MGRNGAGISVALSVLLLAVGSRGVVWADEALDGMAFVGEVGKQGKASGDPDELIFAQGTFRSTACDQYGFGDAPYTSAANEDTITFSAETISPKEGRMEWRGTVTGETLEGTAMWRREGKAAETYWVRATLKPSPAQEMKEDSGS